MLLWSTVATPICVTVKAEGWWLRSLPMAVHVAALWHWHQQQNIPIWLVNLPNLLLTKQLWELLCPGNDSVLGFMRLPWIKDCKCCRWEESHSATWHAFCSMLFFFPQQLLLIISLFGDNVICVRTIILPFLGNIIKISMSLVKPLVESHKEHWHYSSSGQQMVKSI